MATAETTEKEPFEAYIEYERILRTLGDIEDKCDTLRWQLLNRMRSGCFPEADNNEYDNFSYRATAERLVLMVDGMEESVGELPATNALHDD